MCVGTLTIRRRKGKDRERRGDEIGKERKKVVIFCIGSNRHILVCVNFKYLGKKKRGWRKKKRGTVKK